jgi:hypothetical protein
MDLSEQLELLLGKFDHLAPRIRHLDYETTACGERIEVRCSYLSFRDGLPTFDDFIEVVARHTIAFCLPRSEIRKATEKITKGDHVLGGIVMNELASKAKKLFIKARKGSHRSGESGEIVLYILNEWLLKAPQIVSKMYLKTNNNMPVHGTDGIHAKYDAEAKALRIYWGESKAYLTLDGALDAALKSIAEFREGGGEDREIEIVSNHLDVDAWDPSAREALLDYLDPYSEASNKRIPTYSCLLVHERDYSLGGDKATESIEKEFVEAINSAVEGFIEGVKEKVEKRGLASQRFEFFLLPVPSVQDFRDKFQEKIGWPDD